MLNVYKSKNCKKIVKNLKKMKNLQKLKSSELYKFKIFWNSIIQKMKS